MWEYSVATGALCVREPKHIKRIAGPERHEQVARAGDARLQVIAERKTTEPSVFEQIMAATAPDTLMPQCRPLNSNHLDRRVGGVAAFNISADKKGRFKVTLKFSLFAMAAAVVAGT